MRRMLRILFNGLTMLSLLLCIAFAGLWVRSYWRLDDVRWAQAPRPDAGQHWIGLASGRGGMAIGIGFRPPTSPGRLEPAGWRWDSFDHSPIPYAGVPTQKRWGFGYESFDDPWARRRILVFPLALPMILFALLPLTRGARFIRRRRRFGAGRCRKCGYDLRATPDRCPECGTAASIANAGEGKAGP